MSERMTYGCIGEHLGHSFSKEIHQKIGDYDYRLKELAPEEVPDFFKKKEFLGINVTVPYKQTVIPFLDEIDEAAMRIHAVNTVVNKSGKLIGINTDFEGMRAMLRRAGISLAKKKILILGTGGTSKTALAVAEAEGASRIVRVSRTEKEDAVSYERAKNEFSDAEIIVNTTPCGMFPNVEESPISLDPFFNLCGVADAVYNPLRSELVLQAEKRGIPTAGGLYMLVRQAMLASEFFFDKKISEQRTEEIYRSVLSEKENVVLIGMPGCGKSTVGKILAEKLGFSFADTDEEIIQKTKKSIPEIFSEKGEEAFRDLETQAVRDLAALNRCVIATGGGAVLREENVRALRKNGRIVFLDRALSDLIPTADRPTADSEEAMARRYRERYPIYAETAEMTVSVTGTAAQVAENILERRKSE